MAFSSRLTDWLETHGIAPSFSGGVLAFFALCFFGAATNTMAGWLYALSGLILALLGLGAFLPRRSLRQLTVERLPIAPVMAGDNLTVEINLYNHSSQSKTWLEVQDILPSLLNNPQKTAIELIPPHRSYHWVYYLPTKQRGIYHWQEVHLRSGSPLGLFWCRYVHPAVAKAIVYPQILPLQYCPLVESLGQDNQRQRQSDRLYQAATEGVTKAIRDYRVGDPTRLIHWRSTARFDQFKVRELETMTGGQEVAICLDSGTAWSRDRFEQAVIIAASLYFYAGRCQLNAKFWTAQTGLLHGNRVVLEALAAVEPEDSALKPIPAAMPLIWITATSDRLEWLTAGSRWVLLPEAGTFIPHPVSPIPGMVIDGDRDLQSQLQSPVR